MCVYFFVFVENLKSTEKHIDDGNLIICGMKADLCAWRRCEHIFLLIINNDI